MSMEISTLALQVDSRGAVAGFNSYDNAANKAAASSLKLGTNADAAQGGVSALGQTAKATAASLAALAAGGKMVSFFKSAVEGASNTREEIAKFGDIFENVIDDATKARDRLTGMYGQSTSAAMDFLSVNGNLLFAMGANEREALRLSGALAELAVDMSAFYNTDPSTIVNSFSSALVGMYMPLRKYGIALSDEIVKTEMLRQAKEGVVFASEREAKANAIVELSMRQASKAVGYYAQEADSYANLSRTMANSLSTLKAKIGEGLIDPIRDVLAAGTSLVNWFNELDTTITTPIVRMTALGFAIGTTYAAVKIITAGFKTYKAIQTTATASLETANVVAGQATTAKTAETAARTRNASAIASETLALKAQTAAYQGTAANTAIGLGVTSSAQIQKNSSDAAARATQILGKSEKAIASIGQTVVAVDAKIGEAESRLAHSYGSKAISIESEINALKQKRIALINAQAAAEQKVIAANRVIAQSQATPAMASNAARMMPSAANKTILSDVEKAVMRDQVLRNIEASRAARMASGFASSSSTNYMAGASTSGGLSASGIALANQNVAALGSSAARTSSTLGRFTPIIAGSGKSVLAFGRSAAAMAKGMLLTAGKAAGAGLLLVGVAATAKGAYDGIAEFGREMKKTGNFFHSIYSGGGAFVSGFKSVTSGLGVMISKTTGIHDLLTEWYLGEEAENVRETNKRQEQMTSWVKAAEKTSSDLFGLADYQDQAKAAYDQSKLSGQDLIDALIKEQEAAKDIVKSNLGEEFRKAAEDIIPEREYVNELFFALMRGNEIPDPEKAKQAIDQIYSLQSQIDQERENVLKQQKEILQREKASDVAMKDFLHDMAANEFSLTSSLLKGEEKRKAAQSRIDSLLENVFSADSPAKAVQQLMEASGLNDELAANRARQESRVLDATQSGITSGSMEAMRLENRIFTKKVDDQTKYTKKSAENSQKILDTLKEIKLRITPNSSGSGESVVWVTPQN